MNGAPEQRHGWYHGWNIVTVCVLSGIASNGLAVNAFPLFLHDWSVQMQVPISTLTLGMAACAVGCALISPFAGSFIDRRPARQIFAVGLVFTAIFCLALSFVDRAWQFLLLYALVLPVALVCAASMPANALVSRWFVRRLGLALGLTSLGMGMAGVLMPPVIAAVMPLLGWRAIWRIGFAVTAFLVLPLLFWVVRERPDAARDGLAYLNASGTAATAHGHDASASEPLGWTDILGRRNFWLLVVAYLPFLAVYTACGLNLAPIAASRLIPAETVGLLISAYSFAQLAAMLGGGMLADRFGNRLPLAALGFLGAAGCAVIAFAATSAALMLGAFLAGIAGGFWPMVARAIAIEYDGKGFGRAFGLLTFFLPIAVMSPFALAKVQEHTGSYVPVLLLLGAASIVGGIACLFIRERHHVTPAEQIQAEEAAVPLL